MKQYRPNVDLQKWVYSREQSRAWVRRRQGKSTGSARAARIGAGKRPIPDNSEPWLPGGVNSVADALWISDRIKETTKEWRIPLPPQ